MAFACGILLLLLLTGCSGSGRRTPEQTYADAVAEQRRGNADKALEHVERGFAEFRSQAGSSWYWRFLLLKSELLLMSGKAGQQLDDVLALLEGKAPEGPDAAELTARWLKVRADAKYQRGELEESRRLFERAHEAARAADSPRLLASIEQRLGVVLAQNDPQAAEKNLRSALENAERAGDPYLKATVLGNLGWARQSTSRYDEAAPWWEQALAIARKEGYQQLTGIASHNLGICYNRLGDFDKALKSLAEAEAVYTAIGFRRALAGCLGDIGNVHYYRGDLESAIDYSRRGLELAREMRDTTLECKWLNNLAAMSVEAGDPKSAEDWQRQALELIREEHIRDNRSRVWAELNAARIQQAKGASEDAEKLYREVSDRAAKMAVPAVLLEAQARLGSLYARTGRWEKADAQFRSLTAAIDRSRLQLRRDDWKLTFQSSIIPFLEDYVGLLMERGQTARALEVVESSRARFLAEKLGLAREDLVTPKRAGFQAKARAADAILMSYWLAPRGSYLWVVTPTQTVSFPLPPEQEVGRLVEDYRKAILSLDDPAGTQNPAGRKLYELLVAPAEKLIPPGSNVVIVPDGPLHHLNFEALPAAGAKPEYWLERVTIAMAPSLELLPAGAGRRTEPGSLLLVGNPVPPGKEFSPLPEAAVEMSNIQRHFPAGSRVVLTGERANPKAYFEADPGRFSLIHFSAHALANDESPLDSAVILSGSGDSYKLYAREVTGTRLKAGLVTVSACRSAGTRQYSGEGLVGFAWAFLQAGAWNVVAGLWDVSDRSTALLMSRLYEELSRGKSPAGALRAAKLSFLDNKAYRRPYFWAPFQLFTRGDPFRSGVKISASDDTRKINLARTVFKPAAVVYTKNP